MRNIWKLCMALAMLISLGACASNGETKNNESKELRNEESELVTVTDHLGYEVEVVKNPSRVVVVDILPLPSVLTVFFNSAEKLVGIAPASMKAAENGLLGELYPEILNANTSFYDGTSVNMEELTKLNPEVVFYNANNIELGENLRKAGFAAVAVSVNKWDYNCIETLNHWVELLSEIFPESDKAETVTEYSNKVYDMIQERVSSLSDEERVRTFFLFQYSDTTMMTSGKLFFGQWWADAIGAINVAEELTTDNSVATNMEQVYAWNPELIFITNFTSAQSEDLYNNTIGSYDWSGIEAVENKRVFKMPLGMYRSYTPGADTPMTLLYLAKCVYPNLFEDIDVTEEVKKYYREVFSVELTDAQVEGIFAPTSAASAY